MSNIDKLYLGTWQFADVSERDAVNLIAAAHDIGIHNFDTARVYAGGSAERLLGRYCAENDTIVTKIPAIIRDAKNIAEAYPTNHVVEQTEASIAALGRRPDTILLHNWQAGWENNSTAEIESLKDCVNAYGVGQIGVSLPNGYQGDIEAAQEMSLFDVVELPFNNLTPSIDPLRIKNLTLGKQILARSLFRHGEDKNDMSGKIRRALETNASIVLGATTTQQIQDWKELL